jgi:hypothetical protein
MAALANFISLEPLLFWERRARPITLNRIAQWILTLGLLSPWPLHQLSAAIWTDIFHLRGAAFTESAFVRADHRQTAGRQLLAAFFAFSFHLQCHAGSLSNPNVHQVRAAELRHVARLLARDGQQPRGQWLVPFHGQTGYVTHNPFQFVE